MLGKPRVLSLFPNSFNESIKHEHSCKILYTCVCQHLAISVQISVNDITIFALLTLFLSHFSAIYSTMKTMMMAFIFTFSLLSILYNVEAGLVGHTAKAFKRREEAYRKCCVRIKCFYPKFCKPKANFWPLNKCKCLPYLGEPWGSQ